MIYRSNARCIVPSRPARSQNVPPANASFTVLVYWKSSFRVGVALELKDSASNVFLLEGHQRGQNFWNKDVQHNLRKKWTQNMQWNSCVTLNPIWNNFTGYKQVRHFSQIVSPCTDFEQWDIRFIMRSIAIGWARSIITPCKLVCKTHK